MLFSSNKFNFPLSLWKRSQSRWWKIRHFFSGILLILALSLLIQIPVGIMKSWLFLSLLLSRNPKEHAQQYSQKCPFWNRRYVRPRRLKHLDFQRWLFLIKVGKNNRLRLQGGIFSWGSLHANMRIWNAIRNVETNYPAKSSEANSMGIISMIALIHSQTAHHDLFILNCWILIVQTWLIWKIASEKRDI